MRHLIFLLLCSLLLSSKLQAQECYFLKNVLDTMYRINPTTGLLAEATLPTDYPTQSFFGYLSSIDPVGRRYLYITRLSATDFESFGIKILSLDSFQVSSVPLSGFEAVSPGLGQFSFHGLEYGAIADKAYMTPVSGDSLYEINLLSGAISAVQDIPTYASSYSYLQTFHQSEQRYAMIGIDTNGDRRFYQVDIDDDTTYVSPPMNFPEPLRALEVSDISGNYYVISDADQTFYEIDPINGTLTALFPIPGYQNALGYLHTFDYDTDQYLSVGMDTLGDLQLYSIFPASGTISSVPFPVPAAAYYGLEATNTQFIARMLNDLTPTTSLDKEFSRYFQLFPNPSQGQITLKSSLVAPLDLQVLSLEGKILWEGQMVGVQQRLDLPALPDGIYLIRITDSEKGRSWQQSFLLSP